MSHPVILSAVRLPIGKFQGSLKSFSAPQLGALAVRAAIERGGIDAAQVDEVNLGCVLQAGLGQNPARQAALGAGLPPTVAALTVNQVCGSGLRSVMLAAQAIQSGDANFIVAGGMESMSNAPYVLQKARDGYRMGNGELVDVMIHDGLWCAFENWHMGNTAEVVSEKYGVSREEQDAFSAGSQNKAVAATAAGAFAAEIEVVRIQQKKGDPIVFATDEGPRAGTTAESLAGLRPAFRKDGTVTAGNASTINDGAAAVVVTSEKHAETLGRKPVARIVAQAMSGIEPKLIMMAPVEATKRVIAKAGWTVGDVDLFEFNEAFAAQAIAVTREVGADPEKVNVNGGSIALGHPIGASGARVLVTLLHAMQARGAKRGVTALCLGGGNAVALAVESF
jgi:acetyl-CoA C-acetyltransferase